MKILINLGNRKEKLIVYTDIVLLLKCNLKKEEIYQVRKNKSLRKYSSFR